MDNDAGIRAALTEGRAPTAIEALRHLLAVADAYSDEMRKIGRGSMELGADAPWPSASALAHAAIQAHDMAPQPKAKKARRKKAASLDEAMSPGGAAWSKAARGAGTYASAQPSSIASRAMAICSREENKALIAPRPGARYWFRYSDHPAWQAEIAGRMAQLAKLGVTDIECESREEYEAKQRAAQMRQAFDGLPSGLQHFAGSHFPDAWQERIRSARILAREMWKHGERAQAYDLTLKARAAERLARTQWPNYSRLRFPKPARQTEPEAVAV